MSDGLLKCENVILTVDGNPFGGATALKSVRKNEVTRLGTFLSDVPVYVSKKSSYELDLELDIASGCPFAESDSISEIVISCDVKSVRYSDCTVKNMQTVIKSKGRITAEITLDANERTVI